MNYQTCTARPSGHPSLQVPQMFQKRLFQQKTLVNQTLEKNDWNASGPYVLALSPPNFAAQDTPLDNHFGINLLERRALLGES